MTDADERELNKSGKVESNSSDLCFSQPPQKNVGEGNCIIAIREKLAEFVKKTSEFGPGELFSLDSKPLIYVERNRSAVV